MMNESTTMEQYFDELSEMVWKLNQTNSKNTKLDILAEYPNMQGILLYTYDPYRMYGISSKNLEKNLDKINYDVDLDIFDLLDKLSKRELTGHAAMTTANGFIDQYPKHKKLIYNIIDKNLKTRTDAKLINKVYPGLIPQFNVALAHKYQDHVHKINWDNEDWVWSRKLDGLRVIARKENNKVTFYSRKGKEFTTFDIIKWELEDFNDDNFVLDGEMCILDDNGNEDFTSIVSQARRKDYTISNPKYMIFDCLNLHEFDEGYTDTILSDRLYGVADAFANCPSIQVLEMKPTRDVEHVIELSEMASNRKWEGIMLRRDCEYEGKRTHNLLKVKKMHDAEYIVKSIETGPFRIIDSTTGLERTIETLTNVIIEHKGNKVSVGSGFSLNDRNHYFANPELIVGHEITVQYFEESTDKDGKISLRFPICKHVYVDSRRQI